MKTNIVYDEQREEKVQTLITAVLRMSPEHWDDINGLSPLCPFCNAKEHVGDKKPWYSMAEIAHESDCAYLIAKGLSIE